MCTAVELHGQAVRLEAVDSLSGMPVVGAVVTAIDVRGEPRVERLLDANGSATVGLPAEGEWRFRIRRIGYAPFVSAPTQIRRGNVSSIRVQLPAMPRQLPATAVRAARTGCGMTTIADEQGADLFQDVALALRSVELSGTARQRPLLVTRVERTLDRELRPVSERIESVSIGANRPFASLDRDTIVRLGYAARDADGSFRFFAPDERVLADSTFEATHCFTRFDSLPSDSVLLGFRPVEPVRRPAIAGLWRLDGATRLPSRLDFTYVLPQGFLPTDAPGAGGTIALQRLADGSWYVSRWSIRMPLFAKADPRSGPVLAGYREVAGDARPQPTNAERAAAFRRVRDSVMLVLRFTDDSGRALSGGEVVIGDRPIRVADDGRVRIQAAKHSVVTVRVRRIGYAPVDTTLRVTGVDGVVSITMSRIQQLGTASVTARRSGAILAFERRRLAGFGSFMDSAQVAARSRGSALDLLYALPGLRVYRVPSDVAPPRDNLELSREWVPGATIPVMESPTSLSGRGGICLPSIIIDGQRASVAMLQSLEARDVTAVESYSRSTQVPSEFGRMREDLCGAVIVWTRFAP